MSDERQEQETVSDIMQETVSDIMSEMRGYADSMEKHLIYDLRECATDYLRVLADRIEDAEGREIAELRKGISELLDALQAIYDEECTGYGTGEVYDKWRKALKGASND